MLLVISTSSTAYLALAAYMGFFALRVIVMPHLAQSLRVKQLVVATLVGLLLMAVALLAVPQFLASASDMILHMTVNKSGSDPLNSACSGRCRGSTPSRPPTGWASGRAASARRAW
jgi:hypothetical protein